MKRILIIFLTSFSLVSISQNEKCTWFFGPTNSGLQFNIPSGIVATTNIHYTPYTNCGSSVIVDTATGNLKFYTDGKFVIDNSHLPMPNGIGLFGGNATHSSGLVVPKPGDCEKYYVFTITTATETSSSGNLYYSLVDMLLPGNGTIASPKGNIISSSKNILVSSNVSEALNVVKNTSTGEYWLIAASNSLNQLLVFKISSSGISIHSNYTLTSTLSDIQATSFNPINNKFFVGSFIENQPCLLLDFNITTGFFVSSSSIPGTPLGTSTNPYAGIIDAEWSSDGTKLYISKYRGQAPFFGSGRIYQYDLNFPASPPVLVFSPNTSSQSDVCKGLRLGPDNKIYFSYNSPSNPNTYIGCINNPNNPAGSCNINEFQINFTIPITGVGLFPRFPYIENASVDISVVGNNSICSGQNVTLTASGANNYVWSGGVSASNSSVTVSPSVTTTYNVTGSNLCGSDSDSITVTVNPYYEISTSSNVSICQGQSTTLTANGSPSYNWSGGISSTNASVTVSPNITTTYYVAGELTACGNDVDTIVVTIQNLPSINITGNQSICSGQNVTLTASGANNYVWSGGVSSSNSSVTVNPSVTTTYYVTGTNSCGSDSDSITITVNPYYEISTSSNVSICQGQSTTLTANGSPSYNWSGGISSTNASVTVSPNITTTYYVAGELTACGNDVDTIVVTVQNLPSINITGNQSICSGQNVTLTASGANNYVWSGGVSSSNSSVTVSPSVTTSYYVTGSNSCGSDSDSITVTVNLYYEISTSSNVSICQGQSTTLTANGSPSYNWSGGISSTNASITVSPNITTTYYVAGELTTCGNDVDTIVVTVQNLPSINITGNQSICSGQNVTLTASGVNNYVWSGGVSASNSSVTVSPSVTTSYYVTGSNSCGTAIDTFVVEVNSSSLASFSYKFDECTNKVLFENTSQNSYSYLWNFGDNTVSTLENPEHTYFQNGVYSVNLIINQGSGCSSNSSQSISISGYNNFDYQIPNVFTPNGDGVNDEFKLDGLSVCNTYRIIIYNRWGQVVFEAEDASSQFWNGNNGNKKEAIAGVYYYILTVNSPINNSESLSGYITVIP